MIAAHTWLPVLGVPVESKVLKGVDSLLSIVQMPAGVAVGTLAIGVSGAKNAALARGQHHWAFRRAVRAKVEAFRKQQTDSVLSQRLE